MASHRLDRSELFGRRGGLPSAAGSRVLPCLPRPAQPRRATPPEALERRRLLSVAPVAVDDVYDPGPGGTISVDVAPTPGAPAWVGIPPAPPTGPFTEPDFVKTVESGRHVTEPITDFVVLGESPDSYGDVTVRDPGSTWTLEQGLAVGAAGRGSVTASDGARFEPRGGVVVGGSNGPWQGGTGSVTVTGRQTRLDGAGPVHVTRGTLRVLDRAAAVFGTTGAGSSGNLSVGTGTVEVLDGASLRPIGTVNVGYAGLGASVRVAGGGVLDNRSATFNPYFSTVGNEGGSGTVTVTGPGSRWHAAYWMGVGDEGGRGAIFVENGGLVAAHENAYIGDNGGNGRVVVTGDGSAFEIGTGLRIGIEGGAGSLHVGAGATARVRGINSLGERWSTPTIENVNGRISGSGRVVGEITNYGLVSPGDTVGVLTVEGGLLQPAAAYPGLPPAAVRFDIGGTRRGDEYDGLDASGAVEFAGGRVVLNFVEGFAPAAGDRFELVRAGTLKAAPQDVEVRGLAEGFQYAVAIEGGSLVVTARSEGTYAPRRAGRRGVLANDVAPAADGLSAVLVRRPEHGTVTLFGDGSFHYAEGPTFAGADTFQYVADDGVWESNVATVTLRGAANRPPTAAADAYATDEDVTLEVLADEGPLANDTDDGRPSGGRLSVRIVQHPAHGTLSPDDGAFTYIPDADFNGTDSFTYEASDGWKQSAPATVTLTVRPVNDVPVAADDSKVVRQGRTLSFRAADLAANDTDVDGGRLAVTAVSATSSTHGIVALLGGRILYRPDRNYAGPAAFTYTVSDGRGGTATGVAHVTVTPRQRGTPGTVFGRGTLDDRRRRFAVAISARPAGVSDELQIWGSLTFEDGRAGVGLRSTAVTVLAIDPAGRSAAIAGEATVNGVSGYRFEATAEDRSHAGGVDRFRIVVTCPDGGAFRYDSTGNSRNAGRLDRGGNVVVAPAGRGDDRTR